MTAFRQVFAPSHMTPSLIHPMVLVSEVRSRLNELDNQQLAALYIAVEQEHVNRQAALVAGQQEYA